MNNWSYEEAFSRNLGLISKAEQEKLRNSSVAIAGAGGVGGWHILTLARLGIGRFAIADGDQFSLVNFNRQAGATTATIGQSKAMVMASQIQSINPEAQVKIFDKNIDETTVDSFLNDANVFVDGIDFFAIEARRMIFRRARDLGIWGMTAGPVGFSTAWVNFDPEGMSFDDYFDLSDGMTKEDQLIAFLTGLAPSMTQADYIDMSMVNAGSQKGPSVVSACLLCAGVVAAEVVKVLLDRAPPRAAPYYQQFDPYVNRMVKKRLYFGNRNPKQLFKRWVLKSRKVFK